jgi:hypothetical protein
MRSFIRHWTLASCILGAYALTSIFIGSLENGFCQSTNADRPLLVRAQTKPDKPWQEYLTVTIKDLKGYSIDSIDNNLNEYGGRRDHVQRATGFFHADKVNDRWWIIDPNGNFYYNKAVVSVTIGKSKTSIAAVEHIFADERGWADSTARMLWKYGFNGTGAWTDESMMAGAKPRLPYTVVWNFMSAYGKKRGGTFQQPGHTGYPGDCIFVFDPEFENFCDTHAQKLIPTKDDPFLLGHYSDNEMPFPHDALDNYLKLDTNDYGYKAAHVWIQKRRNTNDTLTATTDEDRALFLELVADRYFRIISNAIRKYDPNHMFLGARFHGKTMDQKPVMVAAGRYVDVLSINYYYEWTPDQERMKNWTEWSGKPFIITEWYVKGADAGLPNISGAGWIVPTQADRGLFYQNFTLHLLQMKSCVGWQWFKYIDNDPKAKGVDPSNNDSNKGIVTINFDPYTPLLEKMQELNSRVYTLIDYFDAETKK